MSNQTIKDLYFQPWIGAEFESNPNGKLLLLGESHYINEGDKSSFSTTSVIHNFLANENIRSPFFRRIELLFKGSHTYEFWDSLAFANLIQNSFLTAKDQPNNDDIATIKSAFNSLLINLQPKKVLVLSKRLWNWLPEENSKHIKDIVMDSKKADVWEYQYQNGTCYTICIKHPSRMFGNQYKDWTSLIEEFVNM